MMEIIRHILICVIIKAWLTNCQAEEDRKVCFGTSNGVSYTNDGDRYSKYRDHYAGCKVIEGNLEIVSLTNVTVDYDLSFLRDIEEVTGYVLIALSYARFIPLTNLRIIRGRNSFTSELYENKEFALFITSNYDDRNASRGLRELQLRSLTEISSGSALIRNNKFLCHIDTIDWSQILSRSNLDTIIESNAQQCLPCPSECRNRCWSVQPTMCQKLTRNCSDQCEDRCFGPLPIHCCHSECSAGCTGPKEWQCLACRNYRDENRCVLDCPPLFILNQKTDIHERNPNAKFKYRSQCVKKCPVHMSVEHGACVAECQRGHIEGQDGVCVLCNGTCPKHCNGTGDEWINERNIESFKDCIKVRGNIKIQQSTFSGQFQIHQLSALKHIREITGYLSIDANHIGFTNLSFFKDLEIIKGQQLYKGQVALKIYESSLVSLSLNSLKEIREGDILIKRNPNLCFVNSINWRKLLRKTNQSFDVSSNRNTDSCEAENFICSDQCSVDGCMGSGRDECLECEHFQYENDCIESCSGHNGVALYLPKSQNGKECAVCHDECLFNCSGPGADHCSNCKNFLSQSACVGVCPQSQYPNDQHVCTDCNEVCNDGCTGPGKNLGPGGCNSCHLVLLDADGDTILGCLPKSDKTNCFNFKLLNKSSENSVGMKSKASCQKCPQLIERDKCVNECSPHFYANLLQCIPCHSLCLTCSGSTQNDCLTCSHFKVYDNFENRKKGLQFNCSDECPLAFPQPIYEGQEGICAPKDFIQQNNGRHLAMIVGMLIAGFVFLGIVILLILILRRQLVKTEEKKLRLTAKLTGIVECEPLTMSNTKPDMSVLRLIKESDLKRRNIIGSGAFGTVYKGFWVPEDDSVKIPVAIKVLQEGSDRNESLLEEARIMASVDHPCCVRILAVCMTAQMMLVTQLMPLGSLLEYVRKNKDNIGSKVLLNWCTQIAKGMAYLEERGIIHRDLAARNVLVQNSLHVKITDFGLAKMTNKDERFQESSGKWPIKWLALESIQHKMFTHKSDVWSFGVTIWELCTYGQLPYDGISARNVVDLLEKGERLPQPSICTIDVYMIMIKCWMLHADSRPNFSDLSEELAKMARDPGRYLVVQNDSALQLVSHSVTNKDLLKFMSLESNETSENIISGDDYINSHNQRKSSLKLQNAKGKVFLKDETKTETTPLLRLNIPRRSTAMGTSDSGPESPRYSPDPSSLTQTISFQRPCGESKDFSSSGTFVYQLPEKIQEPSPPPRVQSPKSSDYLQPVISPKSCPAYLELEYDSVEGNETSMPQEKSKEDTESKVENHSELNKRSLPPAITVTNPDYFNQVAD